MSDLKVATTSPCANGACLNGGLCQTVNNVAVCSCLPAYTGKNCETCKNSPFIFF